MHPGAAPRWATTATASATGSTARSPTLRPDELIVDSFPGGILGELCGMTLPPARHVARRLRWAAYAAAARRTAPALRRRVRARAARGRPRPALRGVEPLALPAPPAGAPLARRAALARRPLRAGARARRSCSRTRADAPRIVVVSPRRPARLPARAQWRDVYPVAPAPGPRGADRHRGRVQPDARDRAPARPPHRSCRSRERSTISSRVQEQNVQPGLPSATAREIEAA